MVEFPILITHMELIYMYWTDMFDCRNTGQKGLLDSTGLIRIQELVHFICNT